MSKLKVSVLQSDIFWENSNENLNNINRLILSQPGADLYVLPEMFNSGFTSNTDKIAESDDGYTVERIKEISRICGAAICGSLILRTDGKNYNTFVFVKPDGSLIKYNKRHLFGYGGEADMFSKGEERVIAEYMGFRILLLVCYDLRFPVWSRNNDDYDMIIYVSNWPASRRLIHDILVRARAIENQSFVVACNRVGADGKDISYSGGSSIIDYKGTEIAIANDNLQEIIKAELDLNAQNEFKKNFPAQQDRDSFVIL